MQLKLSLQEYKEKENNKKKIDKKSELMNLKSIKDWKRTMMMMMMMALLLAIPTLLHIKK